MEAGILRVSEVKRGCTFRVVQSRSPSEILESLVIAPVVVSQCSQKEIRTSQLRLQLDRAFEAARRLFGLLLFEIELPQIRVSLAQIRPQRDDALILLCCGLEVPGRFCRPRLIVEVAEIVLPGLLGRIGQEQDVGTCSQQKQTGRKSKTQHGTHSSADGAFLHTISTGRLAGLQDSLKIRVGWHWLGPAAPCRGQNRPAQWKRLG